MNYHQIDPRLEYEIQREIMIKQIIRAAHRGQRQTARRLWWYQNQWWIKEAGALAAASLLCFWLWKLMQWF